MYCDCESVIHVAKNPIYDARTKFIHVWYHYIWLVLEDGTLALKKIKGCQNPIDMLMNIVTKEKLKFYPILIGFVIEKWGGVTSTRDI